MGTVYCDLSVMLVLNAMSPLPGIKYDSQAPKISFYFLWSTTLSASISYVLLEES